MRLRHDILLKALAGRTSGVETHRMAIEHQEDRDLATRVSRGDTDAFDAFYHRHADLVFGFILHQLNGARPDAEEIWQDTFLAAIRNLPSYRGQSRLLSWLCGIARHKVAEHWRRRTGTGGPPLMVSSEDLMRLADSGPLPEEVFDRLANLVSLPIASLVIVLRRKSCPNA